jgi:hypothetical protein
MMEASKIKPRPDLETGRSALVFYGWKGRKARSWLDQVKSSHATWTRDFVHDTRAQDEMSGVETGERGRQGRAGKATASSSRRLAAGCAFSWIRFGASCRLVLSDCLFSPLPRGRGCGCGCGLAGSPSRVASRRFWNWATFRRNFVRFSAMISAKTVTNKVPSGTVLCCFG